jgi:hypothetical protein
LAALGAIRGAPDERIAQSTAERVCELGGAVRLAGELEGELGAGAADGLITRRRGSERVGAL